MNKKNYTRLMIELNDEEQKLIQEAELAKRWALHRLEERILTEHPFDYSISDQIRFETISRIQNEYLSQLNKIKTEYEAQRQEIWKEWNND